jgi:uncharacterized protein (DUF1810 family)
MMRHRGKSTLQILGSPDDDLKFRSSVDLFDEAAGDTSDRLLFKEASSSTTASRIIGR